MNRYNFVTACITGGQRELRYAVRAYLDALPKSCVVHTRINISEKNWDFFVFYSGSFVSDDGHEINGLPVSFSVIDAI